MPSLPALPKPRYLALAQAIETDLVEGRLRPAQRLPPQRQLARHLGLDFTTVARGYAEAQRRGLVESRVGDGTFVAGLPQPPAMTALRVDGSDFSMNMPPEASDPALWSRVGRSLDVAVHAFPRALRYQRFGGSDADKQAALEWLERRGVAAAVERVFLVSGAHVALLAAAMVLADRRHGTILTETLTYPGMKAIAEQLGLQIVGVPTDADGLLPDAFAAACRANQPLALYLNPTLSNPTTTTIPLHRRHEIAAVARSHGVPILEDDPYGLLHADPPPPFATVAPDLTWHVSTLSKCLGAGLRVAYVVVPDSRSGWAFAAAVRAANVMVSPITAELATRLITDGVADAMLAALRAESRERQALVAEILPPDLVHTDPAGFHFWLSLPTRWSRSAFVGHMAACGLGIVASDAFATTDTLPEAVRVCLGGPAPRETVRMALNFAAHALSETPARASGFL